MRLLVAALLAAALLAPAAHADDTAVDIEIAIDTTGSMTPSIENAQRDARKIVANTQQTLPNARFAMSDGGSFTARRRATLSVR